MSEVQSVGVINCSKNFKWTIENAKNIFMSKKNGEYVLSPPIIDEEIKWFITVYPKGMKNELNLVKIYLGIFQENTESAENYDVGFEISILNENDVKILTSDILYRNFQPTENHSRPEFSTGKYTGRGFSFFNFLELNNYLTQDQSFIINCRIHRITTNLEINFVVDDNSEDEDKSYICNNFIKALNNEKFSDVELIIGNKKYMAHKVILASKSRVLENILKTDKNIKRQAIEINDLSDDAAVEMLRFIYTNEVENINQVAKDLLEAADKYDILELKKVCEEDLIRNINVENAIDFLIMAEAHSAEDLKIKAIQIIVKNISQLNNSDNWLKLNPVMITKIISALKLP